MDIVFHKSDFTIDLYSQRPSASVVVKEVLPSKKKIAKFKNLLRISLKIIKIKKREMTKLFGRWISTMMTVGISSLKLTMDLLTKFTRWVKKDNIYR